MTTLFVAPVQKAKGVTAQAVYQADDNPNDITVTHDFATDEAAHAFVNSEELKSACRTLALLARRQSGSPPRYSVTTLFPARLAGGCSLPMKMSLLRGRSIRLFGGKAGCCW
jgi:hypothetical protein